MKKYDEKLHERLSHRTGLYCYNDHIGVDSDDIDALLDEITRCHTELARMQEDNSWIPCSERLPEIIRKDGEVNVVFVKYKKEYSPDCGSPYSVCNTFYMSSRPESFECWNYTDTEEGK